MLGRDPLQDLDEVAKLLKSIERSADRQSSQAILALSIIGRYRESAPEESVSEGSRPEMFADAQAIVARLTGSRPGKGAE